MQGFEKPKLKQSPSPAEKEAAAALRAELQLELQNKRQCAYQSYECTNLSLDGYNYCLKHILIDKNAPFKQCCFVYSSNNKRCPSAAPRGDKKDFGYCNEHALKVTLTRNRQNCKYPAPHTAEVLVHSLSHYVKRPRGRNSSTSASSSHQTDDQNARCQELKVTESLDPFTEVDVCGQLNLSANDGVDVCSDSESDMDAATYGLIWHDGQADSSDNESIDSEQEDYMKHANVYTAEEITMVTREKLLKLQSLYVEQYRHLQYILREKRRKYLHALKREKETCCNIYNQVRDNIKEQRLYKKLKALSKYHKTHGPDAILNKRAHDLRNKMGEATSGRSHSTTKCAFTEGGVKCGEKPLPLARHCRKHILEDPNQVLFRPCGKMRSDLECNTPVEAIFEDTTCNLHMDIPVLRSYSQPRKDSDSDYDDSLESANIQASLANLSSTCNVKSELIDFNISTEIPKMSTVPTLLFEETSNSPETKVKEETDNEKEPNVLDDTNKISILQSDAPDTKREKLDISEQLEKTRHVESNITKEHLEGEKEKYMDITENHEADAQIQMEKTSETALICVNKPPEVSEHSGSDEHLISENHEANSTKDVNPESEHADSNLCTIDKRENSEPDVLVASEKLNGSLHIEDCKMEVDSLNLIETGVAIVNQTEQKMDLDENDGSSATAAVEPNDRQMETVEEKTDI